MIYYFDPETEAITFDSNKFTGSALNFIIIRFNPYFTNDVGLFPQFSSFPCDIQQTPIGFKIPSDNFADLIEELKYAVVSYNRKLRKYKKNKKDYPLVESIKIVTFDKIDDEWVESYNLEIKSLKKPINLFNDYSRIALSHNSLFVNGREITF